MSPADLRRDRPAAPTALAGLSVLDLSGALAAALTSMVLVDNGAAVIKIERPDGDPLRRLPAAAMWYRAKASVIADLTSVAGIGRVRDLARGADVVIYDWRPGTAARLGLDHESLAGDNPGLISCSITGFGPRGPLQAIKGYDAIVAAKTGFFTMVDARPKFSPVPAASFAAANAALQGIFAALYRRTRTGRGQLVETSLAQGLTGYDLYDWLAVDADPELTSAPGGGASIYPAIAMLSAFTRDGRCLQFGNFLPHQLAAFLRATELTEWYAANSSQPTDVIVERARRRISEQTWAQWEKAFAAEPDIAGEPYRTPQEVSHHPQLVHNGSVVVVDDPQLGPTRQLGPLVMLRDTPADVGRPAAAPGTDTDTAAFGPMRADPPRPIEGNPGSPPLAGVTVIELAWFYAAPFGLALLADLGARVIKVENLTGDPHRHQSGAREYAGVKALQGKESLALDFTRPEGKEILDRLLERADLVMRNFRQEASVRMGIDYDAIRPLNPELFYLYAGAYGSSGPSVARPAYAPTIGVGAGHQAYQLAWPHAYDQDEPMDADEALRRGAEAAAGQSHPLVNADAGAALGVGTAMLLGLIARDRTGRGQAGETSMLCTNAYAVSSEFLNGPLVPAPAGTAVAGVGLSALYRLYEAGRGWVCLAVTDDVEWAAFAAAIGPADGSSSLRTDRRFITAADRIVNDAALADRLTVLFAERSAEEWEQLLTPLDVACVAVSEQSFAQFTIDSPSMTENGFVGEVEHPHFGRHRRHGGIISFSESALTLGPGNLCGQHTRSIMAELGYSDAEIADLRARNIIGWPDD